MQKVVRKFKQVRLHGDDDDDDDDEIKSSRLTCASLPLYRRYVKMLYIRLVVRIPKINLQAVVEG